jgi:hypothetical protein
VPEVECSLSSISIGSTSLIPQLRATDSGYRIYEVEIYVALAWMYLRAGDMVRVLNEAKYAKRMSADMGYHWG